MEFIAPFGKPCWRKTEEQRVGTALVETFESSLHHVHYLLKASACPIPL